MASFVSSTPFILHISFTIEEKLNQQIAFLDFHKDNMIINVVYHKATHMGRYLDFSSHYDRRHTISMDVHCAIKLQSTSQGKNTKINHVTDALWANNCA